LAEWAPASRARRPSTRSVSRTFPTSVSSSARRPTAGTPRARARAHRSTVPYEAAHGWHAAALVDVSRCAASAPEDTAALRRGQLGAGLALAARSGRRARQSCLSEAAQATFHSLVRAVATIWLTCTPACLWWLCCCGAACTLSRTASRSSSSPTPPPVWRPLVWRSMPRAAWSTSLPTASSSRTWPRSFR